jgi:hypothetical protein
VPAGDNGNNYYLTAINTFNNGTAAQSQSASLTVVSGLAQFYVNPQPEYFALEGDPIQLSATAYGTLPLGYQWQYSPTNAIVWTSLADNGNLIGSQSNVLTMAAAQPANAGYYQLVITNSFSVAQVIVGTLPIGFNGNGLGWSSNSVGTYYVPQFTNGLMFLTDSNNSETRSSFFQYPLYIGAFEASFTYQDVVGGADGFTFIIQNSSAGASAIGGGGSGLGCADPAITPSAELCFELYDNDDNAPGWAWATNGSPSAGAVTGGFSYSSTAPVNLLSEDPINMSLYYNGSDLAVTLSDAKANTSFSTSIPVGSIPQIVGGDTAYVGFTAATGGVNSYQTITNFTFVSLATENLQLIGTNAEISWSQYLPEFVLQTSTNLLNPVWVNVANAPVTTNGTFRVTVPVGKGARFYRLAVP